MTRALFACGGARLPKVSDHEIRDVLDWRGTDPTLEFEMLEASLIEAFPPLARDLLEIAGCVYGADRLVSRGGADLYGRQWRRDIELIIPVREVERWRSAAPSLAALLNFLTDDTWRFQFQKATRQVARPVPFVDDPRYRRCDCVALFSGGVDSLAGALWDRQTAGHRSLLVSHRSNPVVDNRQRDLVRRLNAEGDRYEHISFWVHLRGRTDRETTQRSRSFLFLAVAEVLARQFTIPLIHVFENGVLSINLPIAFQVVGTMASRTTHPRFLTAMERLCDGLFGRPVKIELPFLLRTKREVVELLRDAGGTSLLEHSSSCAHPFWRSALKQHCGICSQCIDRRFAVEAAGLGSNDRTYERDLFVAPMTEMPQEAEARSLIEGYLRTYREVGELGEEAFWVRFSELTQLHGYMQKAELRGLHPMFQRQWKDIDTVLQAELAKRLPELVRGTLPADCVLQLVLNQQLNRASQARYADRLARIAERAWRVAFSGRRAADEAEVQRALATALAAAEEDLEREHPLFRYVAGVKAKPDFSEGARKVWVEVKYPRAGSTSVRDITEEIAADLMKYSGQAEHFVFLVHDPDSLISDRERFIADIEAKDPRVLVRVI